MAAESRDPKLVLGPPRAAAGRGPDYRARAPRIYFTRPAERSPPPRAAALLYLADNFIYARAARDLRGYNPGLNLLAARGSVLRRPPPSAFLPDNFNNLLLPGLRADDLARSSGELGCFSARPGDPETGPPAEFETFGE